jgi:isoleucyl-tRNA synthetase
MAALETMSELIQEELNVKSVEFTLDESSFVTYAAKANFKSLGSRMGKSMKTVAAKVGELGHAEIKAVLAGQALEWPEGTLTAEDLTIVRQVKEGLVVGASPGVTAGLDAQVDEELRGEMLVREAISRIQGLRKEADLAVSEKIRVYMDEATSILAQAVQNHIGYITAEVFATELTSGSPQGSSPEVKLEVDGESAVFRLERVG